MSKVQVTIPRIATRGYHPRGLSQVVPHTSAVPILAKGLQRTAAWHELRRHTIGASDIGAVLKVPGAYQSPFSLWWQKQPGWVIAESEEMEWGRREEPIIAKKFAEAHSSLKVLEPWAGMFSHHEYDWMTCTPDRLAVDRATGEVVPVELKSDQNSSGRRWGPSGSDVYPPCYRWQVLWQCAIMGSTYGWLVAKVGKRFREYRVQFTTTRTGASQAAWADDFSTDWQHAVAFGWTQEFIKAWHQAATFRYLLETGLPPDIDGDYATTEALKQLYQGFDEGDSAYVPSHLWVDAYKAKLIKQEAEQTYRLAENRIRKQMGTSEFAIDEGGNRFAKRSVFIRGDAQVDRLLIDAVDFDGKDVED